MKENASKIVDIVEQSTHVSIGKHSFILCTKC